MAIDTILNGNLRGSQGVRGSTWSSTEDVPTVTTDRLDGDFNIDTVSGKIYELQIGDWTEVLDLDDKVIASTSYAADTGILTLTFRDGTTFGTGDLRGPTGPAPVFATGVVVTQVASGNPATATINNADPLVPILSLGLVTGAAGVAAAGTVSTTTIPREAAYIRYTISDNPGTVSADFPREVVDITIDGTTAYNKFNSITPPVGDPRGQLIFQLTSTGDVVTQSGFVNVTAAEIQRYQIWSILNAPSTTGAVIAAEIAGRIDGNGDAFQRNSTILTNGETWDIDVTAVGNILEIRDKDGQNIVGTFSQSGTFGGLGWGSANIAEVPEITALAAGQSFTTGSFIVYENIFYGCILGYNSSDNNVAPDANVTNWVALN